MGVLGIPTIDWVKQQQWIDGLVKQFGQQAVLRRNGAADRWIWCVITDYSPQELQGRQYDPLSRRALVSAVGVTIPPQMAVDRLITFNQPLATPPAELDALRILAPPTPYDPAGTVLFWELNVRR
jgi:hypothetical protein